jgi:hypothetical protein
MEIEFHSRVRTSNEDLWSKSRKPRKRGVDVKPTETEHHFP